LDFDANLESYHLDFDANLESYHLDFYTNLEGAFLFSTLLGCSVAMRPSPRATTVSGQKISGNVLNR